jgi:preprotein translocase subunit SecD
MNRRLLASLLGVVAVAVVALGGNLLAGNKPLLGLDLQGGASITYQPLTNDYDKEALDEVDDLYRERIESLNVGEAEVVRQGDTIVVNLPGVKDQEKAIQLVGTTGKVTFRPVLQRLGGFSGLDVPATGPTTTVPADGATTSTTPGTPTTGATGTTAPGATTATTVTGATTTAAAASTTAPAGPARVPQQGTATTVAATTVPATTAATATTAAGATTTPGATSTTTPGETSTTTAFDPSSLITPADQDVPDSPVTLPDRDGTTIYQLGPVFALGENAVDTASAEVDPTTGGWRVALTLKGGEGGLDAWNAAAAQCYSKSESCPDGGMAIVIDHRVISAPVPQQSFFDSGDISITGNFKESEARQLARVLKYGATPVEMKVQASQTVSATIGKDSLRAAVVSGLIGVALVLLFMVLYYRRLAIVMVCGVCLSAALLWSLVSLFPEFFVLTLAGVTGLIVSIGVTVDSYVVFFERFKDEIRTGRSLRNSAQRGFTAAWRTIVAADLVSLLGAAVLWYLSVGSVRGFALFLGLSTLCDLVIAWFFTRPAILLLARRGAARGGKVMGVEVGEGTLAGATA